MEKTTGPKSVPTPPYPTLPVSDSSTSGGSALTTPVAPPTNEQPKGSPDK